MATVWGQLLGHDVDGNRWYAEIRLDEVNKPVRFTDGTEGVLRYEFAVQWAGFEKGKYTEPFACGQAGNEMNLAGFTPAKGWTFRDVTSLWGLWKSWHLNSMNAASDEQEEAGISHVTMGDEAFKHVDSHGYRYGTAWLARQLPDTVVAEIQRLQTLGVKR